MEGRFTEEELAIAKSVDLCAVAESLGYTVKGIGKYHTLKEMDSIRIYDRSHMAEENGEIEPYPIGGRFCGALQDSEYYSFCEVL